VAHKNWRRLVSHAARTLPDLPLAPDALLKPPRQAAVIARDARRYRDAPGCCLNPAAGARREARGDIAADETEVPARAGSTRSSLVFLYRSKRLAATGCVENQQPRPMLPLVIPSSRRPSSRQTTVRSKVVL
jgi:hypothetical protein